jgi:hypothetical protein
VQGNFPFSGNANNPEPDNCATRWPGSTQFVVDPPVDATSDDGAVTGDVSADGKLLNVTANGATFVLGVVVKGGNNFNAYTVVGNAIPPDMKSPLNNGGQLPTISHYTICYDPRRDGQISVEKKINAVGGTAKPDDAFVIGVDCNVDTYDQEIVLTVAAPGPEKSTAIPVGTDCVVAEKSLPAASTRVSYDPNGGTATTPPTVTVEEVGQTIAVVVTNGYAVQLAPTFTGRHRNRTPSHPSRRVPAAFGPRRTSQAMGPMGTLIDGSAEPWTRLRFPPPPPGVCAGSCSRAGSAACSCARSVAGAPRLPSRSCPCVASLVSPRSAHSPSRSWPPLPAPRS